MTTTDARALRPMPAARPAVLVPEKKTLKRLEDLRALRAPAASLVERAVEILAADRGLMVLDLDARALLAQRLVDDAARRRPVAEVIGETVRERSRADKPGATLPFLKSAARTLNLYLQGARAIPAEVAPHIEAMRVVEELRVEKRDGGAQLVAWAPALDDAGAPAILAALRGALVAMEYPALDVRIDASPRKNQRVIAAKDALDAILARAAVPVAHPRTPEDVLRRCREFKIEHRGGRDVVVGRVFSTDGVTQHRILAAMRELLRRRAIEDVAVRIELVQ